MRTTIWLIFAATFMSTWPASAVEKPCGDLLSESMLPSQRLVCVRQQLSQAQASPDSAGKIVQLVYFISSRALTNPDPDDLKSMELAVDSLEKMQAARPIHRAALHAYYVASGMFDAARRYRETVPSLRNSKFPVLYPMPARDPSKASYWSITHGVMREHQVNLKQGAHVVVVSSPGCHYCNEAAAWISKEFGLRTLFKIHSLWIDRPDPNFGLEYYADWNKAHPTMPVRAIIDTAHWPMPAVWATPRFVFMRDGKIVKEVPGWTEESPEALRAGLAAIGLMPAVRRQHPELAGRRSRQRAPEQLRSRSSSRATMLVQAGVRLASRVPSGPRRLMDHPARAFAIQAHGAQTYGDRPYVFHLDAVAALVAPYGDDAITIAYLHDTVEDTSITVADIERLFGAHVAACVALLTDEPGATRKERKAKTYARLATVQGANTLALTVKAADRLANVRACVAERKHDLWQVYRGEHPVFRSAAYRSGQCEPFWVELDSLLSEGAFDAVASAADPARR